MSQSFDVVQKFSFNLYCPVVGKPNPSITWTSLLATNITADTSIVEDHIHGFPVLRFRSPQLNQSDVYRCVAQNSAGRIEITFNLNVIEKSNTLIDPEYLNENIIENIELERGAFRQVQCPFEDKRQVFWEEVGNTRKYLPDRFYVSLLFI